MIKIERFVNQLMTSNCYIVVDEASKHCICIDPASEESCREIQLIESEELELDYVILTHEHTDHTWGVNALIDRFSKAKVLCSFLCKKALPKEAKAYFRLYYDNLNYVYNVKRVDYTIEDLDWRLDWFGNRITFISTPGHSPGSVCVTIGDALFGGDTLMPFKPVIKKRNSGSIEEYQKSLNYIENNYSPDTIVYPGHGESMKLKDILHYFDSIRHYCPVKVD